MDIAEISAGLHLESDGIWYGPESANISYPADDNANCFEIEDISFWFQHRNECILSVVRSFPPATNGTIFDIGGGNGFVSRHLLKAGFKVAVVEPGRAGARNARKRGIETVICSTIDHAGLRPSSMPAVGLFDVIEHVPGGDALFLNYVRSLMQPQGLFYATVPAFNFLWSDEDERAGHIKRYRLGELCTTLRESGFEVLFSSYIFRFLPVPIFLLRALPYRLGLRRKHATTARHHAQPNHLGARMLSALRRSEIDNLNAKTPMHFGGSCLIVARRAA